MTWIFTDVAEKNDHQFSHIRGNNKSKHAIQEYTKTQHVLVQSK